MNLLDYLEGHQRPFDPPRLHGLVRLAAADFAGVEEGVVDIDAARERFVAIQAEADRDDLRHWAMDLGQFATTHTKAQLHEAGMGAAAAFADIQQRLGIVWEHAEAGRTALGKVIEPPIDPGDPLPWQPLVRSYTEGGQTHDPAWDYYPFGPWGPHWGCWAHAPCDGEVRLFAYPTPLETFQELTEEYRQQAADLFRGWTCRIDAIRDNAEIGQLAVDPQQTMYVPVFYPAQPLVVQGVTLAWLGQAHVDGASVQQGHVRKGARMWRTGDSGVRFEDVGIPGRASHAHLIAGATLQLAPNGTISGGYAALAFGWPLGDLVHGNFGPQSYLSRMVIAGRPASDWQGRELPPTPPW